MLRDRYLPQILFRFGPVEITSTLLYSVLASAAIGVGKSAPQPGTSRRAGQSQFHLAANVRSRITWSPSFGPGGHAAPAVW